jgi:hypothetical protein
MRRCIVYIWVIQVAAASLDFLRAHNITRIVNCSAVDIDNHFENQPLGDETDASKLIQYMSFYSDDADPETDDPGEQRRDLDVIADSCFGNSERLILSHYPVMIRPS